MALIKCQECGKEISDKSAACVNCGCPITPNKVDIYVSEMPRKSSTWESYFEK